MEPGFSLTGENWADVVEICRLVGGMPLGILLASAWVDMLSPAEIARQIKVSLDFLQADWQGVPERQHSMRAVFDHSWQLLTDAERVVLKALSVFRGSFALEAAQAVAGATLHDLRKLVAKSLVQPAAAPPAGGRASEILGGRYELHELLREYAAGKLAGSPHEEDVVRDRHAVYFSTAMERWGLELKGPRQGAAAAEMTTDFENACAAWDWAVERPLTPQLDQASEGFAMAAFCVLNSRVREAEAAVGRAAKAITATTSRTGGTRAQLLRVRAKLLIWQCQFRSVMGEPFGVLLRQAGALLDGPVIAKESAQGERAFLLLMSAVEASRQGHLHPARRLLEESLALYRVVDDRWAIARVMSVLSGLMAVAGDYDQARKWQEQSLGVARSTGDVARIPVALAFAGSLAMQQGQLEEAERLAREAITLVQDGGDEVRFAHQVMAECLASRGAFAQARASLEESLRVGRARLSASQSAASRLFLGLAQMHLGQYGEVRTVAEAASGHLTGTHRWSMVGRYRRLLGSLALVEGAWAEAQQQYEESIDACRHAGKGDPTGRALASAAYAARGLGQAHQARRRLCEALRPAVEIQLLFPMLYALPAAALLHLDEGKVERAAELYALASCHEFVSQSKWFEDVAGREIAAAAESLPPQVIEEAKERGRARDLWRTAKELLAALEERQCQSE